MMNNQQPMNDGEFPNIWWKCVLQSDYAKIGQIGEITSVVRILPCLANNQIHESIFEKDVSTSRYPNTKKWLVPILVISDALRPENNGFVGVMEISKTLKNKIISNATPPNYYDPNQGFNFNIVVSIMQGRDGNSFFPNYSNSHFDNQPSSIDANQIFGELNKLKLLDFATWVRNFNDAITKKNSNPQPQQGYVNPQATTPPTQYNFGQQPQNQQVPTQPMNQTPMNNQVVPINNQQVPQNNVNWEQPPSPPVQPTQNQVPQNNISNGDFNSVFGTPDGNDVPF